MIRLRDRARQLAAIAATAALVALAVTGGPARYGAPPPPEAVQPGAVEIAALPLQPGIRADGTPPNTAVIRLPDESQALKRYFAALDYQLETVREGLRAVPQAYVTRLPSNLDAVGDVDAQKRLFLRAILPNVLRINAEMADKRRRLEALDRRFRSGMRLDEYDARWLVGIAKRYGVPANSAGDVDRAALLERVDVIPPSLTLAQSILESGWGTSRFTLEGNALFGQRTWQQDAPGVAPGEASGFRVRAFRDLAASIRSYVHNLNVSPAYKEFREMRAALRAEEQPLNGYSLAGTLHRYSEEGHDYVEKLRGLITQNSLQDFDVSDLRNAIVAQHLIPDPEVDEIRFARDADE